MRLMMVTDSQEEQMFAGEKHVFLSLLIIKYNILRHDSEFWYEARCSYNHTNNVMNTLIENVFYTGEVL